MCSACANRTTHRTLIAHRCLLCAVRVAWRSHVTTFQEQGAEISKAIVKQAGPDIIGTQEGQGHQLLDLHRLLPEYQSIGGDRLAFPGFAVGTRVSVSPGARYLP